MKSKHAVQPTSDVIDLETEATSESSQIQSFQTDSVSIQSSLSDSKVVMTIILSLIQHSYKSLSVYFMKWIKICFQKLLFGFRSINLNIKIIMMCFFCFVSFLLIFNQKPN